jgi:homoserine kinase
VTELFHVRVSVPATSANLGTGFDSIGVALALRGEVELSLAPQSAPPPGRGEMMALEAAAAVFTKLERPLPALSVTIDSEIPMARGLGASAVIRVGAAVAAAVLAGADPQGDWLLAVVSELEHHADNVAPALLGGLQVVVWDATAVQHVRVPVPADLRAVIFVPRFEMPTDESRNLLPASLSRADVVHNSGRAALLVAAMAAGRLDLLRTAVDDRLHQPARAQLFPAMYELFDAALSAGAACAYLSGGGSAILAVVERDTAGVANAFMTAALGQGVDGDVIVTQFSEQGATIVSGG